MVCVVSAATVFSVVFFTHSLGVVLRSRWTDVFVDVLGIDGREKGSQPRFQSQPRFRSPCFLVCRRPVAGSTRALVALAREAPSIDRNLSCTCGVLVGLCSTGTVGSGKWRFAPNLPLAVPRSPLWYAVNGVALQQKMKNCLCVGKCVCFLI